MNAYRLLGFFQCIALSLSAVAGCGGATDGGTDNSSVSASTAESSGRDGYIELTRVASDGPVSNQFGFVAHDASGSLRDSVHAGDAITAVIPADVALDLGAGGKLSGTLSLGYEDENQTAIQTDVRGVGRRADGNYVTTSFTIPSGVVTLVPRISMFSTASVPGGDIGLVSSCAGANITIVGLP